MINMAHLLRLLIGGRKQIEPEGESPHVERARERLKTAQRDFIIAVSGVVAQNDRLRRAHHHAKKNT